MNLLLMSFSVITASIRRLIWGSKHRVCSFYVICLWYAETESVSAEREGQSAAFTICFITGIIRWHVPLLMPFCSFSAANVCEPCKKPMTFESLLDGYCWSTYGKWKKMISHSYAKLDYYHFCKDINAFEIGI